MFLRWRLVVETGGEDWWWSVGDWWPEPGRGGRRSGYGAALVERCWSNGPVNWCCVGPVVPVGWSSLGDEKQEYGSGVPPVRKHRLGVGSATPGSGRNPPPGLGALRPEPGFRGGGHKMLWFCCLPHLTGHKMSGNYTRVIRPLSTFVGRNPRPTEKPVVRGPNPSGNRLDGVLRGVLRGVVQKGELQRGRQVREPEGALPRRRPVSGVARTSHHRPSSALQRCTRAAP